MYHTYSKNEAQFGKRRWFKILKLTNLLKLFTINICQIINNIVGFRFCANVVSFIGIFYARAVFANNEWFQPWYLTPLLSIFFFNTFLCWTSPYSKFLLSINTGMNFSNVFLLLRNSVLYKSKNHVHCRKVQAQKINRDSRLYKFSFLVNNKSYDHYVCFVDIQHKCLWLMVFTRKLYNTN